MGSSASRDIELKASRFYKAWHGFIVMPSPDPLPKGEGKLDQRLLTQMVLTSFMSQRFKWFDTTGAQGRN